MPDQEPGIEVIAPLFAIVDNEDGTFALVVRGADGNYYEVPVTRFDFGVPPVVEG